MMTIKPLTKCCRTNHTTSMPGNTVNTPAADSTPQSMPDALTVRVITTTMGFASLPVKVRANNNSTQLNMKQKKTVTPMALRLIGKNIRVKKNQKLWPSIRAISSISVGTPDMKPSRIQTDSGTVNRQCARATAKGVSNNPMEEYSWKKGSKKTAGGAIRLVSNQKKSCRSPRKR